MCKRSSLTNNNDTESLKDEDFRRRGGRPGLGPTPSGSGWSINSPSGSECGSPSTKPFRHKKPSFVFPPTYREWYTLLNKLSELEKKIASVEEEKEEAKENMEFINCEKTVLAEQLKELEDLLFSEKNQRKSEKDSIEDLASHSKVLYEKVCSKNEKIRCLEEELKEKDSQIERLASGQEDQKAKLQLILEAWTDLEAASPSRSADPVPLRPKSEDELISRIKRKTTEVSELSKEISSLRQQMKFLQENNASLQSRVKSAAEVDRVKVSEQQLKEELRQEREKVASLLDESDGWKEKLRCSEVISQELKRQIKEMSSSVGLGTGGLSTASTFSNSQSFLSSNNPLALKSELKTVREVIAAREEMIQKLNEKYMRHRQVWEENERRANEEIKKLDELIDRVILTLSSCSPMLSDCPPLKRLLDELTQGQVQGDPVIVSTGSSTISSTGGGQSQPPLSSTFV